MIVGAEISASYEKGRKVPQPKTHFKKCTVKMHLCARCALRIRVLRVRGSCSFFSFFRREQLLKREKLYASQKKNNKTYEESTIWNAIWRVRTWRIQKPAISDNDQRERLFSTIFLAAFGSYCDRIFADVLAPFRTIFRVQQTAEPLVRESYDRRLPYAVW